MNDHDRDTESGPGTHHLPVLNPGDGRIGENGGDLIVDLSGVRELDLPSLALLLTAQQRAESEDRAVWLTGVPVQIWRSLDAMGLDGFFKPFPASPDATA